MHPIFDFGIRVARRFAADRCFRVADSLSFTTLLAIVPLLVVSAAMLSLFPFAATWSGQFAEIITHNFLPESGAAVQRHITGFVTNAHKLTFVGLVFLFITAVMMMATIEAAFNDIFRVPKSRHIAIRVTSYVLLVVAGPIAIAAMVFFAVQFFSLPLFQYGQEAFAIALPLVFETLAFLLIYRFAANARVRWRDASFGAMVTAVLLEISKFLFAISMQHFSSYRLLYGALAALPAFLLWVYLWWVMILLGAVITAEAGEQAPSALK